MTKNAEKTVKNVKKTGEKKIKNVQKKGKNRQKYRKMAKMSKNAKKT